MALPERSSDVIAFPSRAEGPPLSTVLWSHRYDFSRSDVPPPFSRRLFYTLRLLSLAEGLSLSLRCRAEELSLSLRCCGRTGMAHMWAVSPSLSPSRQKGRLFLFSQTEIASSVVSGMEGRVYKRRDHCPQLLDLIPNDPLWRVRDDGAGGRCKFAAFGEKDLELKLGPPGGEGTKVKEEPAALSLGYFSKHSTNTTSLCSGAKRGFSYTAGIKQEGEQQAGKAAAANSSSQTRKIVEVFLCVIFQSSQDGEVHSRRAPQDYGHETQYP